MESMLCTKVLTADHAYRVGAAPVAACGRLKPRPDFWRKYVGRTGVVVGMPTFGESAPAKDLYAYFGITTQRVVDAARTLAHRAAHRREVPLPDQIVPSIN